MRTIKLYVIWSIIYFPLNFLIICKDTKGILHGLAGYIRSFLLTGSYTQLWYLNALIVAICLIAILLKCKLKPETIFNCSCVLYALGLLGDSYYGLVIQNPLISKVLSAYNSIFITTRNGVFYGMFFSSMGMLLSKMNCSMLTKESAIGYITSRFMMFFEVLILKTNNIAKDYNMFICAIPATYFLFMWAKSFELKINLDYKKIRTISELIFLGHTWVRYVLNYLYQLANIDAVSSCLLYISTIIVSNLIAIVVIELSKHKAFKWLKRLY